jgi:diadenylate cyclase
MNAISLSTLGRGLRWQDAVDVLVLTVLFSRLYVWLRKTVAVQIAVGLLMLVAASWTASHLGLILTSYLLSAGGAVATVVVVVVFQHEIRQGLSRFSPLHWLAERRGVRVAGDLTTILAQASFALAARKKGALIVIPRRDSVVEHVTAGTPVDARLSAALIDAIFTSSSPLHDGAVVMLGSRIARAGVVLPLASEDPEAASGLGTRHRAALGLSEGCDAVVVCVSEERGAVCLACDGALQPIADEPALRRALAELGVGPRPAVAPRVSVPLRLREAWPHLAIFAGVVVAWAALALDRSHAVGRIVPLEIRGVTDHIAFDPPRFTSVAVELRASRRELEILPPDAVAAYADLTGTGVGLHVYRIQIHVPAGIDVVSVMPSSIALQLRARGAPAAVSPAVPPPPGPSADTRGRARAQLRRP